MLTREMVGYWCSVKSKLPKTKMAVSFWQWLLWKQMPTVSIILIADIYPMADPRGRGGVRHSYGENIAQRYIQENNFLWNMKYKRDLRFILFWSWEASLKSQDLCTLLPLHPLIWKTLVAPLNTLPPDMPSDVALGYMLPDVALGFFHYGNCKTTI